MLFNKFIKISKKTPLRLIRKLDAEVFLGLTFIILVLKHLINRHLG